MVRSMTGYGGAERQTAAGRLRAEIRTVNHRFFSANLRLPAALERLEPRIREWVRDLLPRGHANVMLRIETEGAESTPLRVNLERARQYHRALLDLQAELGLGGDVDVGMLSRVPGLIEVGEAEDVQVDPEDVRGVTESAARAVISMREDEGRRLQADLEERLRGIEVALTVITERAPARLISERDRLRAAVVELAGDAGLDEDRLAREIAYLAERWDIGEELVRLRSHIELFGDVLGSDDTEPVGKRLGFLVQEMHREANTIGSKANDAAIEHEVIAIKNEIERLREQVENVE